MGPRTPARSRSRDRQKPQPPRGKGQRPLHCLPAHRYLGPAGGPAPAPTGSTPAWAGIPRLDQLSWGWSMDRHAGELSGYAAGGGEHRQQQRLPGAAKHGECHGHPTARAKATTEAAGLPPTRSPIRGGPVYCPGSPTRSAAALWTWNPNIGRWGLVTLKSKNVYCWNLPFPRGLS